MSNEVLCKFYSLALPKSLNEKKKLTFKVVSTSRRYIFTTSASLNALLRVLYRKVRPSFVKSFMSSCAISATIGYKFPVV